MSKLEEWRDKSHPAAVPAEQPTKTIISDLKSELKKEWLLCDRGTEDSFAYIIDVIFPLFELKSIKHDAAIAAQARAAGAMEERERYALELNEKIEKYLDEKPQPKCVVLSLQMVQKLLGKSFRQEPPK